MNTLRAGLAAIRLLRDRGVGYAFGVPGESFLGLLDALHDTPEIHLVTARHEGAAAFMAEAAGKLTGMPAICLGTRGVGAANLAIGIHTAYQDSTPMLAFLGQVETPFRHREAWQEVELAAFLGPITKWAVEATSSDRLPGLVAEGFRRATTGRPGPVAVVMPGDLLHGEAPAETIRGTTVVPPAPRRSDVEYILRMLASAAHPLIIAGGGVLRSQATSDLVALAELTGTPVMTAFRRFDAFPNDHPLYLGSLSIGSPLSVREHAQAADVILAIGTRLGETTTFGYTVPAPSTRLIQVDVAPEVLGRSFPAEIAVVADAQEMIATLLAVAKGLSFPDRSRAVAAKRSRFVAESSPPPSSQVRALVDPGLVIAELQRQLPADAVITCDAGNFSGWLNRYFRFRQPGTFLGPISGAMGYAVPAAVAAAMVRGGSVPVVSVSGDGGFLMTGSELAVAAQLDLNITCIVFNNQMYGTIRMFQERHYPGRVAGTDLWSPDFVRYAEAFGGLGICVDDNRDIADGVRAVLSHRGIALLEIRVDRNAIAVGQELVDGRADG
jgi:acetolactate synthase-1/2/3 large subunit